MYELGDFVILLLRIQARFKNVDLEEKEKSNLVDESNDSILRNAH